MKLFKIITPQFFGSPGSIWQGHQLFFNLYTENAEEIDYFFYTNLQEIQTNTAHPLSEQVTLFKKNYCVGGLWSWTAVVPAGFDSPIGYLICVWKIDPLTGIRIAHWITDPYARQSTGGEEWGHSYNFQVNRHDGSLYKTPRTGENFKKHPRRLAILSPSSPAAFPIRRPNHAWETSILYECHVRGLTRSPSATLSNPHYGGTYRGLMEQIPYFKQLGITTLELLPIFDFDETENRKHSPLSGERLFNYWGYSPLSFFVPKQSYAFDRQNPTEEFKTMVAALHEANLEIILDVVYNHTGELDEDGPIDHFKGLGTDLWYLQDSQNRFLNHSGCGNTLNCSHPLVKQMILASLRYWANEMGVDGFRFDLAPILNRDGAGHLQVFPSLLWEIRHDPLLKGIKLIAEPWDAGGGYQLGHTAHHAQWAEWNDRYRDTLRQVLRGDQGQVADLKDRLLGSPQIFQSPAKGRHFSLNFITAHDGMTLWDLVTYNEKHNAINGEHNQDGTAENYSHNCGIEGETEDATVLALRHKKMRMFHLLLQLSNGIPMLVAGDEWGRTQKGNNNAYCLDNSISWMDWEQLKTRTALFTFVQKAIAFRQSHFSFMFSSESQYRWFNSLGEPEDLRHHIRTLTWQITHPLFPEKAFCLFMNFFDDPLEFYFPDQAIWHQVFNTALELPTSSQAQQSFLVEGFSMVVSHKEESFQLTSGM